MFFENLWKNHKNHIIVAVTVLSVIALAYGLQRYLEHPQIAAERKRIKEANKKEIELLKKRLAGQLGVGG